MHGLGCGVCSFVEIVILKMRSSGISRNLRVRASYVWSVEGNAIVKSKYARRMSLLRVSAFSIQSLKCVIALEQEDPTRKSSCSRLAILCDST